MINEIIKDNVKIIEDPSIRIEGKDEIKENTFEDSFSKLLSLQLLIQKHSGLKELCKNYYFYFIL